MDGHENDALDGATPTTPAEGGIFSGSDTRVETKNLPEVPQVTQQAPMSSISPAIRTASTVTGDLKLGDTTKKKKWPFVVLGVAVVVVIGAVVLLAVLRSTKQSSDTAGLIGKINTALVFDETAPVPSLSNGSYGYISPKDGTQLIGANFFEADRFFGDYAVVKKGSEGSVLETLIINRAGETIFTLDGDNTATYYDIENNFWSVNGDMYDAKMQKISPEGTTGSYIGNGYILVTTNSSESTSSNQDNSNSSASDGSTAQSDNSSSLSSGGHITDLAGNETYYNCDKYCSALTFSGNGSVYAIVRTWGTNSQIIDLANKQIIYTTKEIISIRDNNVVERSNGSTKYLKIQDGQVTVSSRPEPVAIDTISNSGEYIIESCQGSKYTIKTTSGNTVTSCDIDNYYELSPSLYEAYRNNFAKSPILLVRGDKIQLFDMSKAQEIKVYDAQDVTQFENSPFLYLQDLNTGEAQVCNLLHKGGKEDSGCMGLSDTASITEGYGDYFIVDNDGARIVYNAQLTEIKR